MTAPARISQADIERVVKGVRAGGYDQARIVLDLEKRRIEVMLGETTAKPASTNPWDSLLDDESPHQ